MRSYTVYCDGAIKGNGRVIAESTSASMIEKQTEYGADVRFIVSRKVGSTSSNISELIAAIQALTYIQWPARFIIYSDSEYLVKGFNERMKKWVKNDWVLDSGSPVANKDLWMTLNNLGERHDVLFIWVKAHSGDEKNEVVNKLAQDLLRNPDKFKGKSTYLDRKLILV